MSNAELEKTINAAWEARESIKPATKGAVRRAVDKSLDLLDAGKVRVAEKKDGAWTVNQWLKKAVLLSFRLNDMGLIAGAPGENANWWDKVPSKFEGWSEADFRSAGFRAVPGAILPGISLQAAAIIYVWLIRAAQSAMGLVADAVNPAGLQPASFTETSYLAD